MSRHRNVRSMNYEDEDFYDEDDYYSRSVEDNFCVSPGTAAQFTFNREHNVNFAAYMQDEEVIKEEDEEEEGAAAVALSRQDSLSEANSIRQSLSDLDKARLNSCLEEVHNVLGDSVSEATVIKTIIDNDFDLERSLNVLLAQQDTPKEQRAPRNTRRNRDQGIVVLEETEPSESSVTLQDIELAKLSTNTVPMPIASQSSSKKITIGFGDKDNSQTNAQSNTKKNSLKLNIPEVKSLSRDASPVTKTTNVTRGRKKNYPLISGKSKSDSASASSRKDNSSDRSTTSADSNLRSAVESMGLAGDERVIESSVESMKSAGATPKSKSKGSKIDVMKEYASRHGDKDLLNLVVIGHVDAGKSTLMGHLLYQLGGVNKKTMHKYEQESKKLGKSSFAFAWVLDETDEERTRGVTMDVAQTRFETEKKVITLLDAPGHKDFIPNMITGASQADVAILVINAARGEFETGFDAGGQTREHALLARSLGVGQIIVAVNKMDTIEWSQERYELIKKKIGQFLYKQAGFKENDVTFIPCSGLSGENLTRPASEEKLTSWFTSPVTLVQQIDQLQCPNRPIDKPFRLNVSDVFKGIGTGFTVSGKIGSGYLEPGDKVLIQPAGVSATVKNVFIDEIPSQVSFAGDHVTLTLGGVDMANVNVGSVLCNPGNPSRSATKIYAKIVIFNIDRPITKGYPVVFHYQSVNEPAVVKRLMSQLNRSTGEVLKKKPRCLVKNTSAEVEIELERPLCLELFSQYKDLGRFMLRQGGQTIAAGVVEEILQSKSSLNESTQS